MSEPPTLLLGFTLHWSDCNLSPRELKEHVTRQMVVRQQLPIVVKVGDGFYGFSLKDFPDGKVMLVGGHDTQKRALIRSTTHCHFNVPMDLPRGVSYLQQREESNVYERLTFPTLGHALASSPTKPEALEFDRPLDLKAEAGGEVLSNFSVLYTFDETYLIAHDIYNGLPLLERGITAVPNSAPVCLSYCRYACAKDSRKGLPEFTRVLQRAALGIDYATARPPMNITSYGPQMPPLDDKTQEPSINSTYHYVSEKTLDLPPRDNEGEFVDLNAILKDPNCRQQARIIMEAKRLGAHATSAANKPPPPELPPRDPSMYGSRIPEGFCSRHRSPKENVTVIVKSIEKAFEDQENEDDYDDVTKVKPRRPLPPIPSDEDETVAREPPERTPASEVAPPALAPRAAASPPVAHVLPSTGYEEPRVRFKTATSQVSLPSADEGTKDGSQYEPVESTIIVPSTGPKYCVVPPETNSRKDEADDKPPPLHEETDPKPDPSFISPPPPSPPLSAVPPLPASAPLPASPPPPRSLPPPPSPPPPLPPHPPSPPAAARSEGPSVTLRKSRRNHFRNLESVPKDIASLTVREVGECLALLKLEDFRKTFKKEKIDGQLFSALTVEGLKKIGLDDFQAQKLKMFVGGWRPRETVLDDGDETDD